MKRALLVGIVVLSVLISLLLAGCWARSAPKGAESKRELAEAVTDALTQGQDEKWREIATFDMEDLLQDVYVEKVEAVEVGGGLDNPAVGSIDVVLNPGPEAVNVVLFTSYENGRGFVTGWHQSP